MMNGIERMIIGAGWFPLVGLVDWIAVRIVVCVRETAGDWIHLSEPGRARDRNIGYPSRVSPGGV